MRTARGDHSGSYGIGIVCAVALAALMVGCGDNACDFVNNRDYPSPNGRMVLTTYEYCCYDTTGYDTQLQLRSPDAKLRFPGNVFTVPFPEEFAVSWISASNLLVSLRRLLPASTNVAGVTVTFTNLPPMN